MRNFICFIAMVMIALLSCSKGEKVCCDAPVAPQLPEFYVYGLKNDTTWVAEPNTCYLYRGRLYLEVKSSEETLIISVEEFKGKGNYRLAGSNCRYRDKDGVEYLSDVSPVNSFEVEEYDEATGILNGVLTVNMKLRIPALSGNAVPEIYFSRGQFRLALSK